MLLIDLIKKDKDYKIYDKQTKNKLKWNNRVTLDKGIDNIIKWYMKHFKEFEKKDTKFVIKR